MLESVHRRLARISTFFSSDPPDSQNDIVNFPLVIERKRNGKWHINEISRPRITRRHAQFVPMMSEKSYRHVVLPSTIDERMDNRKSGPRREAYSDCIIQLHIQHPSRDIAM